MLFHVNLTRALALGETLAAGQELGTHIGPQTFSDIAIRVMTPAGTRLVSYFEVLADTVWAPYAARSIIRADLILTRAQRDADPLTCDGERFLTTGTLPAWAPLN